MGIYKKFMLWLLSTKFWSFLLLRVLPYLRFSMYYTRFEGRDFVEGYNKLEPGQFLLCLDDKKATALLVPGFMTHAAFVVNHCQKNTNTEYEVAEMTHKGLTKSYFFTVCKESTRILICECVNWDRAHKLAMQYFTKRFEKTGYDVGMGFGVNLLYCSELIYQLDRLATNPEMDDWDLSHTLDQHKGKMNVDLSDLAGLGRKYISPDGLLFATNTRVVWDSDSYMTGMTGPQAELYCKTAGYI